MCVGLQILSTKVLDDAIIHEAASQNITVDCIPFIEIKPVADDHLQNAIKSISKINTHVVFTSANAVKAVAAQVSDTPSWKVLCISGATKNTVEKFFPKVQIVGTASYGEDLAKIIQQQNIDELIFFCGNKRLNTIPDVLAKAGIVLEQMIVYKTILTPKKVNKRYDGILFFSPSAVESFFEMNRINEGCVSFSVGETTATALKKHTDKIIISRETSERSMCETLIDYFSRPERS